MIDDDIDRQLASWARRALHDTPDTPLPDLTRSRVGLARFAAVAVAAALVLAVAFGVTHLESRSDRPTRPAVDTDPPTAASALVVDEGDTVTGQGVILALPGRPVRFCAPAPIYSFDLARKKFAYCPLGVTVTGIDLARLSDRDVRSDGAIYGTARLVGTYSHETLAVAKQSRPTPTQTPTLPKKVPCPPPAGGWPRGAKNANIDLGAAFQYRHAHPGVIVDIAELRPSADQGVAYVLTVGDPTPVRAALAPDLGRRLCVARSRWTIAQLAQARRVLRGALSKKRPPGLTSPTGTTSDGLGPDAQIQMSLDVPILGQALAAHLGRSPHALIHVNVWLKPAR